MFAAIHNESIRSFNFKLIDKASFVKVKTAMKVATENGYIKIGRKFDVELSRIADNEISGRISDFLFYFPDDLRVIVEFLCQIELIFEKSFGVYFNEGNSLLIVRNFLEFHNFIIIVDGILIDMIGEQINDVFVDVFNVEDFC